MRLIEAYQKLERLKDLAIQTRDAAGVLEIDVAHASKILNRLAEINLVMPICKGLWAFPNRMNSLQLPRYLGAPFPCYISLQSALYLHDMIMQMPTVIYAVTLARTKRFKTPLGEVSLHHIDPSFFLGYEQDPKTGVLIATPEKALLDMMYLSSAKSKLFGTLPEVELSKGFNIKKARKMIEQIPSQQRRTLVRHRFEELLT